MSIINFSDDAITIAISLALLPSKDKAKNAKIQIEYVSIWIWYSNYTKDGKHRTSANELFGNPVLDRR
ncbi:hypothetical protein B0680_01450 [Moraxella pluranimalium]|uniref:Uncharacterized protein n=1 Tax=Moraxella pluranimalium TaxID=470453 RepID=A0A1T0CT67_9GAMM|nr:hypothetical protein B0680_01450 [Moraxella pluranimalium]